GQWTAGGETPTWKGTDHRCHHPLRQGNRLYTSYWQGGFHILNIDDMSNPNFPREVAHYMPDPAPGAKRCQSNDVYQDDRGLIFLIDRVRGLEILERT